MMKKHLTRGLVPAHDAELIKFPVSSVLEQRLFIPHPGELLSSLPLLHLGGPVALAAAEEAATSPGHFEHIADTHL